MAKIVKKRAKKNQKKNGSDLNPGPSGCKTTVLTTRPRNHCVGESLLSLYEPLDYVALHWITVYYIKTLCTKNLEGAGSYFWILVELGPMRCTLTNETKNWLG